MRHLLFLNLICFLAAVSAAGQEPISVPPADNAAPGFYYNDVGATLPELLSAPHDFASHHCKKTEGLLVLGAVVGVDGVPSRLTTMRSAGSELDAVGRAYVAAERFKPGVLNGEPAAVAVALELQLQACKQEAVGSDEKNIEQTVLVAAPGQVLEELPPPSPALYNSAQQLRRSIPGVEHVGRAGVSAPLPTNAPEAMFSDAGRKYKIQGECMIQLVVDAKGEPQNARIVRSILPSLDLEALKAVARYRFKPAMKEGQPVPVIVTIAINFRL